MGYDLHITRRKNWTDRGDDITAEEWLAYVQLDPDLRLQLGNRPHFAVWSRPCGDAWLDWSDGYIFTKYPDAEVIDKMMAIARQLNATVQGDDGEIYEAGNKPPRQPTLSVGERVARWLARFRPQPAPKVERKPLPFGVGDRVSDPWGNEHTVVAIDPKAEHGGGVIRTRRDDGKEFQYMMFAHPFKPLSKQ